MCEMREWGKMITPSSTLTFGPGELRGCLITQSIAKIEPKQEIYSELQFAAQQYFATKTRF